MTIDTTGLTRNELLDNYLKVVALKEFLKAKIDFDSELLETNNGDDSLNGRVKRLECINDKRLCESILGMLE